MDSEAQDRALASVAEWNKGAAFPPTLLPCPFCGKPASRGSDDFATEIRCANYGCIQVLARIRIGKGCEAAADAEAVRLWNTRAVPEPVERRDTGICGVKGPALHQPPTICALTSGHAGWHEGREGTQWNDPEPAPPAEPEGADEFPAEAFEEWAHNDDPSPMDDHLLAAAHWAWARRSEEAEFLHSREKSWSDRLVAVQAARDAALARVEELDKRELKALQGGLDMEGRWHEVSAALATMTEERDAALKKLELAPTIEDMGAMELAYREKFRIVEKDRETAMRLYQATLDKVVRLESCEPDTPQDPNAAAYVIQRARLENEVAFQAQQAAALSSMTEERDAAQQWVTKSLAPALKLSTENATLARDLSAAQERVKELEGRLTEGDVSWKEALDKRDTLKAESARLRKAGNAVLMLLEERMEQNPESMVSFWQLEAARTVLKGETDG